MVIMQTQVNLIYYFKACAGKLLKETHIFFKNQKAQDGDIYVCLSWTQSQVTQLEICGSVTTQSPRLKRSNSRFIHWSPCLPIYSTNLMSRPHMSDSLLYEVILIFLFVVFMDCQNYSAMCISSNKENFLDTSRLLKKTKNHIKIVF